MKAKASALYQFVAHAYASRKRGTSWRELNPALHTTLSTGIRLGLECHPKDIAQIDRDFDGHYWFYGNDGQKGEDLYALAVNSGNIPACLSFEHYAGRPAVPWQEECITPKRLHVGAEFTWQGQRVTITTMKADHLNACTYRDSGVETQYNHQESAYRPIVSRTETKDGRIKVVLGPPLPEGTRHDASRTPAKRFKISYAELAEFQKQCNDERRKWEKELAKAKTLKAVTEIADRFTRRKRNSLRHFDVEKINGIIEQAQEAIRKALDQRKRDRQYAAEQKEWAKRQADLDATWDADMARWMAGEDVHRYFSHGTEGRHVRVRIVGDRVQTSNGMEVSLAGARRALRFILQKREVGFSRNGATFRLDEHSLEKVDDAGAQIGCTHFVWEEIDRFAQLIAQLPATQETT